MKKLVVFFWIFPFFLFSQQNQDEIFSEISATQIKIGQKIRLLTSLSHFKEVEVLWEEIILSHLDIEVLDYKVFNANELTNFEIIFTSFQPGTYDEFYFTVPIVNQQGKLLYLETKKYSLMVENPLTPEEIEVIKNIKDGNQIELKAPKAQVSIPFQVSGIILFVLFVTLFVFFGLLVYYFIYKKVVQQDGQSFLNEEDKLAGWERFVYRLEKITFLPEDNRVETEIKLSLLSEILKELVNYDFEFNASAETTKEIIQSLKELHIDNKLIMKINHLFKEMDLIKFAKVEVNQQNLEYYYNYIKDLGYEFHQYYLAKKEQTDEFQSKKTDKNESISMS
ncbi:MAG: hypothetical protein MJB14_16600 [Spirochaetes bacterium]|nr:hypothetical protein [Spirochaetota bacterium]